MDLIDFYKQLPYADRQFVTLLGATHALSLGINRQQFWHVMRAFLELPPRQDNLKTS